MEGQTTAQLICLLLVGTQLILCSDVNSSPKADRKFLDERSAEVELTNHNTVKQDNSADAEAHQLLNVTQLNDTTIVGKLRTTVIEWMKKPYVHGIVFPAAVGIACAFLVVMSVLSIRVCVKVYARRRRRMRIRNLADELKTDKTMLLGESSDDEF